MEKEVLRIIYNDVSVATIAGLNLGFGIQLSNIFHIFIGLVVVILNRIEYNTQNANN